MVEVYTYFTTVPDMKVNLKMVKRTAMVNIFGQRVHFIKDSGKITILMGKVSMRGQMVKSILENGKKIK